MSNDPWRLRCPNDHTDWHRRDSGEYNYLCKSCGERFKYLIDAKTGERVERTQ
jgi:hypothetical protein